MSEENKKSVGLLKSFGLGMAITLVMGSMVGSGVFKKVSAMSEELLSPWLVVLAWSLAGLVVLFGALSIAELGARFPDSGGPYSWLERLYGKIPSFLYGWASFTVIQTAAVSAIAFIFAGALNTFVNLPHLSPAWESITIFGTIQPFDNIGAKWVAIMLIFLLSYINVRGAKDGGMVSMIVTLIIGVSLIVIAVIAFGSTVGSWETINTPSVSYPTGGYTFFGFLAVMVVAMRNAFYAYEGWITLGFVGEEIKNPKKNLPKAMIIGILLTMLLYSVVNMAYLYVMPIDELITATQKDQNSIAAVLVVDKIFGSSGASIISFMILISTLGCVNATILLSARVYQAMAQRGYFFEGAKKIHSKYKTPSTALWYQAIWCSLLVLSGSFDLLSDLLVIGAFIFYGIIVYGPIHLRFKEKGQKHTLSIGFPFVHILFILFCLLFLVITFIEAPTEGIIGLILIFSGLPFYFYWKKKNGD